MAPPKRPWFRFYVEAVHDRKLRRLKPETRWLFVACLAAARQSPLPGYLLLSEDDPMNWDDLADFAGMSRRQVEVGSGALEEVGVLGFDETLKAWFVPKWNDRQFESDDSTPRAAKSRRNDVASEPIQRPNDDDATEDATPPETETEAETESLPSPNNFESVAPTSGGGGVMDRASVLLATAEATRRGSEIGNPGGYIRARSKPIRDEHEAAWIRLLAADPTMTAEQLVASGERPTSTADQQAMLALMERNAKRLRGEACTECAGTGWVEVDGVAAECKCRQEGAA